MESSEYETNPINVSDEKAPVDPKPRNIDQKDIYNLAGRLLLGIAIIYLASIVVYWACSVWGKCGDFGNNVFEKATTILPPIATLVIGYYFGEKHK